MATKKKIEKNTSDWKDLANVPHRMTGQAQGFQVEVIDENGNYKRVVVDNKFNPTKYRD